MLIIGLLLMVIDVIITIYIMILLMSTITRLPKVAAAPLIRIIVNPVFAFILNLFVSSLIAFFTGSGMITGLANLGSSVLVGALLPPYLKRRYLN